MFRSFLFWSLCTVSVSHAAPLGTIPTIEEQSLRLVLDLRSDLWTSPYAYKSSPVRIFSGEFRIPLLRTETWSASANIYDESLNLGRAEFQLGKEDIFIGNALRSQSYGFGARKDFGRGSTLTFFAAGATASDMPWGQPRDVWFEGSVVYRTEKFDNHQWIFVLNQSNNRGINNGTVFPYVGVVYQPDPYFTATFGFPFLRLNWGNPDIWQTYFNLTPFGLNFGTIKNLKNSFQFLASTGVTVRSYLQEDRVDDNDRLYYQETYMDFSLKKFVSESTGISFSLGGSVDRKLYESERIYVPNSKMEMLENDFYGRIGLEFLL